MKKRLLAILTALMLAGTGIPGAIGYAPAAAASEDPYETTTLEGEVHTQQQDYMTNSQYKKLFGVDLSAREIDEFDPDNTYNPLDGYQPTVLSELFLGWMNRTNNYDGNFAVMENASGDNGFNMDTMWNTNYGGVNTYYGQDQNEDMYTHAINTIALTPGNLTEIDERSTEQILIENRIYLKEDGAFYEDDTRQMLSTYTLKEDGSSWVRRQCKDVYISDAHWAWYIDVAEQQSYTAMAVGDYDGDHYNEVAVYVPASSAQNQYAAIEIYQPEKNGDAYNLTKEYSFSLGDIGARFKVRSDKHFPYVNLTTTEMAGRDDLAVSATLPYWDEDGYCDNGALAVISYQNGTKKIEFNTDLAYDDNAYHFKMQATTNADLNGDGADELVVAGFKNTGYSTRGDARGTISDTENLVNILLYENGKYQMAWSKPQTTAAIDLDHGKTEDAPVALAAGKYRFGVSADTVFLEGTFLDFVMGGGATVNEKIKSGSFQQNVSENISKNLSGSTINIGASGSFVSENASAEQIVFYIASSDGDDVDVDIVWAHPGQSGTVSTDTIHDNYINDTEEDDGTIISMCPVNVDEDAAMMKYTGKTVGWSNPVVYAVLMSMPYWQELDYGSAWNSRGQTDFGISKTREDGTTVTVGLDVDATITLAGEATVMGNGVGGEVDFGALAGYAYEKTDAISLAKSVTWSIGGGENATALMVMPVVTYQYEYIIPEHEATKEEQAKGKSGKIAAYTTPVLCTGTYDPVITDVPVDTYNDVAEEFNIMAEASGNSEDKLPLIDMDEIYQGAKLGDPSSYAASPEDISSVDGKAYLYAGEVHAQTDKGKAVETLSIEAGNSTTESNGFNLGLKAGVMGKVIGGLDFMSIVSVTGSIGAGVSGQIAAGGTWATANSTGITYSGSFANLPDEAEGYGYEYSAGLVKWNASLAGFDKDLEFVDSEEILPDKTVVIAPTVQTISSAVPPALPTDLHVLGVTDNAAVLSWTNPEGKRAPDSYKIYYSMEEDGVYHPLDIQIDGDRTKQLVTGLTSGTTYYFKLESQDAQTSMRSVLSAPVAAATKDGIGPVITKHPQNCYAKVGESAVFEIGAAPQTEGDTLSYQWQQLHIEDFGISWKDINVSSDSSIGRTASFNAAYASPDGKIQEQDIDDLNGNVYRCIVAEHQTGKLDYTETISNSATLYAGEENILDEPVLSMTVSDGTASSDQEMIAGVSDSVTATASLSKEDGTMIENAKIHFALMDKNQEHKCIAYLSAATDASGKASVTFSDLTAGNYEIVAVVMKKDNDYRAAVSNSIDLTVNETFAINYTLNGGINHNLNPTRYALGSRFIILRDAARKGHDFTGWYLDEDLTEKVKSRILNVTDLDGTLDLYAGWQETTDEPTGPKRLVKVPVTVAGVKYYLNTKADGTATITGIAKNNKKTIKIKDTVTIDGVKYKVTAIGANAFQKCKKVTKIVIPSNVKLIKKNAFKGAKKLKQVVFKGKKKVTIKKGAFKGLKTENIKSMVSKKMSGKEFRKFKRVFKNIKFKGTVKKMKK